MGDKIRHFAIGQNVQHKTAVFNNTKVVKVTFDKPFTVKPSVQVTMNDSGNAPAYKTNVKKDSCKVRLKNKWTGEIEVTAMERLW